MMDLDNPKIMYIGAWFKVEGDREVEGPNLDSKYYDAPLKIKKVNIETTENPKIASIGYYWDNQTVERIT
jgi:hypothetical protein